MTSTARARTLLVLGLFLIVFGGDAAVACGAPGESPCSCGIAGLGRCCDYDYLPLVGECSDSSGFPTFCGGTDERACRITEHLRACKSGRVNVSGTCRRIDGDGYPTSCGGTDEPPCSLTIQLALGISSCKSGLAEIPFPGGTCKRLDGDGFPTFCGGEGERPCNLNEHIPSCKSDLYEIPFPGGDCTRLDGDGFPAFCGGEGERPCNLNEHVPSCKTGLFEIAGSCDGIDGDGYPTGCGDVGEPACNLIVQAALGVTSCKPSRTAGVEVAEIPFGLGTCIELDEDGFPPFCGGDDERPCTIVEHIPSCKRDFEEDFLSNTCRDTYPADCGRNGQRPCTVAEKLIPCKSGLSIRDFDFGECGENPDEWSEDEVPRGGPRTVFLIHGRGGDLERLARKRDSGMTRLAHRLFFETPNVKQVYGVDWNAGGDAARKLTIREYHEDTGGTCSGVDEDGNAICQGGSAGGRCSADIDCRGAVRPHEFGEIEFDRENFRVYEIAQALAEAIRELPTERNITIITHSYGGVIGRQLVYRHYDELRRHGKRIAEMVTLMAPHLGGGMATPDVPDGELTQNTMACALDLADLDDAGYDRAEWHNVCELGKWHDFRKRREDGILGPPFGSHYIDDRDYPQIRWINVAANGFPLAVVEDQTSGIDPSHLPPPLDGMVSTFLALIDLVVQLDSDGIILTSSAFGIEADECFPFTRTPGPEGRSIEIAPVLRENYLTDEDGEPIEGSEWNVLSARCHHPSARIDSRYEEQADLRKAHTINDGNLRDFVVAALTLEGDTNGDGVVDDRDRTAVADAGPDRSIECAGSLTAVTLDGSGSDDPAGGGLTFDWSGSFGAASGITPTVDLPLGTENVVLDIQDSLGRTDSDSVELTVADTTAPTLEPGANVEVEATSTAGAEVEIAPDASDACSPVTLTVLPDLAVFPLGTTEVTITAADHSGNETTRRRSVSVVDTTPPAITPPAGVTAEATDVLSPIATGQATATDIFPVTVESDAPDDGFPLGVTTVTWTARDENGNEAGTTQLVTIEDTTPPVVVPPADVTAEASAILSPVEIGTASASDIFGVTLVDNAPAEGFPLGQTFVDWVATDTHANEASARQTVTVVDTTPPSLSVPADISFVAAGPSTPVDPGAASASDIFEPVSLASDAPAEFGPGLTVVTWTAVDPNGNQATATQQVHARYAFGGFVEPLHEGGIYKANRTLPIKFALGYAGGEAVPDAVATLSVVPLGSDDSAGEPLAIEADGEADEGGTFRLTDEGYQYNLRTRDLPAGRYRITVSINDDTTHGIELALR